jgi:hypothetical protein
MGRRLSGHVRNEVGAMIPSDREVEHARELLSRYFRPTRLASAESLAQRLGARVYLKIESDLPTGSFKPRGALNALLTTAAQRPVPGVVAASTGNHGAAVAYAARIAKVGVTIFLPENPNPVKRARIVALGAKVVELGAMGQSAASEGAAEFASEHGHYFLDDASDPLVPAGTATIASEILDEIPTPDVIFVPMMSHASRTTCHHLGAAHCVRAEPMGAPYNRGAHAHARVPLPPLPRSISQWKAVCSCSKGTAGPLLQPFRADEPLGIQGDAKLTRQPVSLTLRRSETRGSALDSVVDERRECAHAVWSGGSGESITFSFTPARPLRQFVAVLVLLTIGLATENHALRIP